MQRMWLPYLLLIAQMWTIGRCKSYYSVIAPGTLLSNRNYTVCVTLHEADGPVVIRVGLLRNTSSFFAFQDVSLEPLQTKSVDFVLPKLSTDYKYELVAKGIQGLSFENSTELLVADRDSLKVFIETSKGIFKPGDLVQFRVIILNEHLKPAKLIEPVAVQILDANDHRVKQFKDIKLIKGIFSGNIQLSEQPNLGFWKILVLISGKYNLRELKPFEVEKYVLPKFSVHIDTVDDFVYEDLILPVTVYGKYVYGKYVEGKVVAKIMILKHVFETKTQDIDDYKATFEFNVAKFIRFSTEQPDFNLEVTLVEKYTNISLTSVKKINYHMQRYKIVVPLEEIKFRHNRPYSINAKVRYLNDTEVSDSTTPVYMKHAGKLHQSLLDEHGVASFTFDYEKDKSNTFVFKKTSFYLPNIFYADQPENNSMCNLVIKTGKIQMGKVVEVEVSSKSYIPYLVYFLTGHSNIIFTKYMQSETVQNSYIIQFVPTIEMVPSTKLCVHYIVRGQINYCDIKISFPDEFENKVTLSTPNTTVQPGQEVILNIQAQPESRVGLLAIDLSAHLLNSNYSLDKNTIIRNLLNDQSYTPLLGNNINLGSGFLLLTNADVVNIIPTTFSGILRKIMTSRSVSSENIETQVRTKFPETWIFKEIDILDENTSLSFTIPDTITTWLVTAISTNEKTGFGITDESLNILVFRPFFISANLPYSIKRGETVAISLTIFNYYEQDLKCQITMFNTDREFQFVDEENSASNLTQAIRYKSILANSGSAVTFLIKPLKLGKINVHITAISTLAMDSILRKLNVDSEGILINDNQEVYLSLKAGTPEKSVFTAEISENIVPESEFLRLSIGGDMLVPSLENLNHLVLLPTGCGEQNMINFAPNILVLDYLKSIGKWHEFSDLIVKALEFIETGYQKELTYRHATGGYSVFGRGEIESTWLTAYVVRFFIKAIRYVSVEPEIIKSGLDFLANKQLNSGEFPNTGHLFYPAHQNRYGFTAFVLISFMESRKYKKQYNDVIQRGLEFLTSNIHDINDTYALSIMALAFQMAQNDKASLIINKLLAMQQEEDGRKWWTSTEKGYSNDVEITSYVLMALLETTGMEHFSIFRWLIEQRNGNGGFKTTHETVVGLQAIIKFSEKYNSLHDTVINVTFSAKDQEGMEVKRGVFEITEENVMIMQQQELPHTTRSIQYEAAGQGNSLLQFYYHYYVAESNATSITNDDIDITNLNALENFNVSRQGKSVDFKRARKLHRSLMTEEESFVIKPVAKMSSNSELLMEIYFKYNPSGELTLQKTNMVILEIHLLSGFVGNSRTTEELLEEELVTKVELENSDTKIVIYFDQLKAKEEHRLQVHADKVHDVRMLMPSTMEMYDFYNTDLRSVVFYEIKM